MGSDSAFEEPFYAENNEKLKCPYCQSEEVLNYEELGAFISSGIGEKGSLVLVQREYNDSDNWPRGSHFVHYIASLDENDIIISQAEIEYCPKCGRDLTK